MTYPTCILPVKGKNACMQYLMVPLADLEDPRPKGTERARRCIAYINHWWLVKDGNALFYPQRIGAPIPQCNRDAAILHHIAESLDGVDVCKIDCAYVGPEI